MRSTLELADADGAAVMVMTDGIVLEVFHTSYDRSFRVPVAWLAIRAEPRRHERVRITVGRTRRRGQEPYGSEPDDWTYVSFELDAEAETQLRTFVAASSQNTSN